MLPFDIKTFKDRIAVITDDGSVHSYDDLIVFSEEVNKIIPKRSLVFCLSRNTIGSLCGYLSFISNKIVPVMLDSTLDKDLLRELIKLYKPEYVWLPESRKIEFKNDTVIFSKYDYSLLKMDTTGPSTLHPDLALLLTTSGSTGSSKFVRISYENLKANTNSIADYLSIDQNERPVTTLPMSYSFGLSIINSHVLKGATLLLTSKTLVEKKFWDFVKEYNASSLSGVPYTFRLLKDLRFSKMHLPSLKTLTSAGGKLSDELSEEIAAYAINTGKRFFVMYGQTEATARMSYLPSSYSVSKKGSIGIPIPGGEFNIVDGAGNSIAEAETVGELIYKGKNVSMGYASSAKDLKKGDENNGTLYTGDLAKRDKDNFYYIVGRKERFIKLFGNRLNLDETENLLSRIISDCACTGHDDQMAIFITDKTRISEVQNYIAQKTGIHQTAFSVRHCDEIPKSSAGKIIYSSLQNE